MKLSISSAMLLTITTSAILYGCNDGSSGSGKRYCADPLPISGERDPGAPGYIVQFEDTVDAVSETDRLSRLYAFEVGAIYSFGFFAEMPPVALEQIRCEATVKAISYNGVVTPATGANE